MSGQKGMICRRCAKLRHMLVVFIRDHHSGWRCSEAKSQDITHKQTYLELSTRVSLLAMAAFECVKKGGLQALSVLHEWYIKDCVCIGNPDKTRHLGRSS